MSSTKPYFGSSQSKLKAYRTWLRPHLLPRPPSRRRLRAPYDFRGCDREDAVHPRQAKANMDETKGSMVAPGTER